MNALRSLAAGRAAAPSRNALSDLATILQSVGAQNSHDGMDTVLAHITPTEAAILHAMGGSGRPDPVTGALHFDVGGDGVSSDNGYGGVNGGERDTPGSGSSTGAYGGGNLGSNDAYGFDSFLADPVGWAKDQLSVNAANPGALGMMAGFATGGLLGGVGMAAMSSAAQMAGDAITGGLQSVFGVQASAPPGTVDYSYGGGNGGSDNAYWLPPSGAVGDASPTGPSIGSIGVGAGQNALAQMGQSAGSPVFVGSMRRGY